MLNLFHAIAKMLLWFVSVVQENNLISLRLLYLLFYSSIERKTTWMLPL